MTFEIIPYSHSESEQKKVYDVTWNRSGDRCEIVIFEKFDLIL